MKATGIVRRIDELGRIVIPKEIRRNYKVREGDQLEIFTDRNGEIILKKYSPLGEIGNIARHYVLSLADVIDCGMLITDRDQVSAQVGVAKGAYEGKSISRQLLHAQEERETVVPGDNRYIPVLDEEEATGKSQQLLLHVICEGDVVGSIIMFPKDEQGKLSDVDVKIAHAACHFFEQQIEM